jgi:hypothetical protein
MDTAERERLAKLQGTLILAARDMEQAAAAARALQADTGDDDAFRRALETALSVCYMRPFTKGMKLPDKYVPTEWPDADFHAGLRELRHKVYAHTDNKGGSGRTASIRATGDSGDVVHLEYREEWMPFPVEDIPAVISFFVRQQNRFLMDASAIYVDLEKDV